MKIKPSKKPKKRYIVFEVSNKLHDSAIHNAIKKSAINVLGTKFSEADIRFLKNKYKPSIHRGVLRVNNKYTPKLIAAINKDKDIKTVGISGILKKAEKKYLKIAKWYEVLEIKISKPLNKVWGESKNGWTNATSINGLW